MGNIPPVTALRKRFKIQSLAASVAHRDTGLNRTRRHAVVLRVAELALRHRIAPISQVAAVQPQFGSIEPVADSGVDGRECRRERCVALVQISIAGVVERDVRDETAVGGQREATRRQVPRRHLKAFSSELYGYVVERLNEVDEFSVVKAVGRTRRERIW